MKKALLILLPGLTSLLQTFGQPVKAERTDSLKTNNYVNNVYRFSATVPDNWKLYGQVINDSINHRAIADWGLPKVHSDLENAEIENSVTITAYKKQNIRTVEELILSEYLRVDPTKYSMEIDSRNKNARLIYGTVNGNNYKGKSYFVFKNDIGYVVTFMGTPGTFDRNIPAFEEFYTGIRFL